MAEQEKFKAWAADHQTMDGYPTYGAIDAWMEGRRVALEEAAQAARGYSLIAESVIRTLLTGDKA